jgi:hypothetical protein
LAEFASPPCFFAVPFILSSASEAAEPAKENMKGTKRKDLPSSLADKESRSGGAFEEIVYPGAIIYLLP